MIDKKFLQFYNYFKDKDGKYKTYQYDWSKGVEGNSREARENMLLDLYRNIWGNEKVRDQVMHPGNFDTIKAEAYKNEILGDASLLRAWTSTHNLTMGSNLATQNASQEAFIADYLTKVGDSVSKASLEELKKFLKNNKKQLDPLSMETFIYNHKQNMAGAALIGIYANNTVGQAKRQFSNIELSTSAAFTINGRTIKSLHDMYTTINGKKVRVSQLCAEFSAASVDNVKDPVLAKLMQTPDTAYLTCFMLCAGMTAEEIGLIFNLPGIKDTISQEGRIGAYEFAHLHEMMLAAALNKRKKAIKSAHPDIDDKTLNDICAQDRIKLEEMIERMANSSNNFKLDSKTMRDAILMKTVYDNTTINENSTRDLTLMAEIISRIKAMQNSLCNLEKAAQALRTITQLGRADSPNGAVGITLAEMYRQRQAITAFNYDTKSKDFPIENAEVLVRNQVINPWGNIESIRTQLQNSSLAKLQAFYSLGIDSVPTILDNLFTQTNESFQVELNHLFEESPYYNLSEKDIQSFMNNYILYELSKTKLFGNDGVRTFDEKRNYYLYKFPLDFMKLQQDPSMKEVFQLGALSRLRVKNGFIVLDKSGRVTEEVRNRYMRDFDSLLYGNDKAKKLAEDLLRYSYYKEGFQFSHNSYGNFFSTQFLTSFPEYIEALRDIDNHTVDRDYYRQFMLNNLGGNFNKALNENDFAYSGKDTIVPKDLKYVVNYRTKSKRYFEYLTIHSDTSVYDVMLDPRTQSSKRPVYIKLHEVAKDTIGNQSFEYYNANASLNDIYNRKVDPRLSSALVSVSQQGFVSGMESEEDYTPSNETPDSIYDMMADEQYEEASEKRPEEKDYHPDEELEKQDLKPCPSPKGGSSKFSPEVEELINTAKNSTTSLGTVSHEGLMAMGKLRKMGIDWRDF